MLFKKSVETKVNINTPLVTVYAVSNKKILGRITCIISKGAKEITISDIECEKKNKGYGSLMMKSLIEFARQNGFAYISGWLSKVDCDHVERLYHFYQKFGFEIIPNKDGIKFADIKLIL